MSAPTATPDLRSRAGIGIGCVALIALALALRLAAAPRELPYLYDWDEPAFSTLSFHMVETGDPNPHRFNYPTLPTYIYALADAAVLALGGREGASEPGSDAWSASARDEWNVPQTGLALVHRQVTAWAGAATCVLTVLLAVRLGFTWAAWAAGLLVALSPYLVESSTRAAVGPWTALCALAALIPLARPGPGRRALMASAVAAGMATACKYNAALVLVPALWCARVRGGGWRDVAVLAVIALGTFALCSPFVFLDARAAARDIGYEIVHYAVRGHGASGEGRGLGNLVFYLRYIAGAVGPLAWLALPGAVWIGARDAPARRVLLFPALYLGFMALQRTAFGRNMEPVFPLAAVFASAALERLATAAPPPWRRAATACAMLAALAGLLVLAAPLGAARERWGAPDSRGVAMRRAAALQPGALGVADATLHVHGEDLARAGGPWMVGGADSVLVLATRDRVGWVLLPSAADDSAGVALGGRFVASGRFGSRPVPASGLPRQPAVTLWVREPPR